MAETRKKKLVHLFFPINEKTVMFFRCILSNTYHIDYHVVVPRSYDTRIISSYFDLPKVQVHQVTNSTMINTVRKLEPDAILLSIHPYKTFVSRLLKNIKCKNIYYIQHGFFAPNHDYRGDLKKWSDQVIYLPVDHFQEKVLEKQKFLSNKSFKIGGLPQIEMLIRNKNKIQQNKVKFQKKHGHKKIIMIIGGYSAIYKKQPQNLNHMISIINQTIEDAIIIIKLRYKPLAITNPKKNHVILTINDFVYDYMFADIYIVEQGGTSYFEALEMNLKTILYQNLNPDTIYNYDIDTKDSSLMICKNDQEFRNYLSNIDQVDLDPADKIKFFSEFIDTDYNLLSVSDQIISGIFK